MRRFTAARAREDARGDAVSSRRMLRSAGRIGVSEDDRARPFAISVTRGHWSRTNALRGDSRRVTNERHTSRATASAQNFTSASRGAPPAARWAARQRLSHRSIAGLARHERFRS